MRCKILCRSGTPRWWALDTVVRAPELPSTSLKSTVGGVQTEDVQALEEKRAVKQRDVETARSERLNLFAAKQPTETEHQKLSRVSDRIDPAPPAD